MPVFSKRNIPEDGIHKIKANVAKSNYSLGSFPNLTSKAIDALQGREYQNFQIDPDGEANGIYYQKTDEAKGGLPGSPSVQGWT